MSIPVQCTLSLHSVALLMLLSACLTYSTTHAARNGNTSEPWHTRGGDTRRHSSAGPWATINDLLPKGHQLFTVPVNVPGPCPATITGYTVNQQTKSVVFSSATAFTSLTSNQMQWGSQVALRAEFSGDVSSVIPNTTCSDTFKTFILTDDGVAVSVSARHRNGAVIVAAAPGATDPIIRYSVLSRSARSGNESAMYDCSNPFYRRGTATNNDYIYVACGGIDSMRIWRVRLTVTDTDVTFDEYRWDIPTVLLGLGPTPSVIEVSGDILAYTDTSDPVEDPNGTLPLAIGIRGGLLLVTLLNEGGLAQGVNDIRRISINRDLDVPYWFAQDPIQRRNNTGIFYAFTFNYANNTLSYLDPAKGLSATLTLGQFPHGSAGQVLTLYPNKGTDTADVLALYWDSSPNTPPHGQLGRFGWREDESGGGQFQVVSTSPDQFDMGVGSGIARTVLIGEEFQHLPNACVVFDPQFSQAPRLVIYIDCNLDDEPFVYNLNTTTNLRLNAFVQPLVLWSTVETDDRALVLDVLLPVASDLYIVRTQIIYRFQASPTFDPIRSPAPWPSPTPKPEPKGEGFWDKPFNRGMVFLTIGVVVSSILGFLVVRYRKQQAAARAHHDRHDGFGGSDDTSLAPHVETGTDDGYSKLVDTI